MLRYGPVRFLLLATTAVTVGAVASLGLLHLPLGARQWLVLLSLGIGVAVVDLTLGTHRRILADFRAGRPAAARRGATFLLRIARHPGQRAALQLHVAACILAEGDPEEGLRLLASLDRDQLDETGRAVWLNNFAYGTLFAGGRPEDALQACNEATALRPGNPAFRSTRGIALLTLGQVPDAIAELQTSVDAGIGRQGPAALAENYYHLARAWEAQGEHAYARDHYLKSLNVAPRTRYGQKSAERVRGRDVNHA